MHERTNIQLSAADRKKLESVIANRNNEMALTVRGPIAVLATSMMMNVIDAAALNAVEHFLFAGDQSLGIDDSHVAATPFGLRVIATAAVLRVEGRTVICRRV